MKQALRELRKRDVEGESTSEEESSSESESEEGAVSVEKKKVELEKARDTPVHKPTNKPANNPISKPRTGTESIPARRSSPLPDYGAEKWEDTKWFIHGCMGDFAAGLGGLDGYDPLGSFDLINGYDDFGYDDFDYDDF